MWNYSNEGYSTIQLPVEWIDLPYNTDLVKQQRAIKSWACSRKVRDSTLRELIKALYPAHPNVKKRRVSEESTRPIPENNLTHQIECLKREVEEQLTLIENLKEEAITKTRIHEEAVFKIQKSDQIISGYCDKAERYKRALKMM